MTREEAIENLRRLQNLLFNDPYIDTSTIIATCNIAIEALEQQPCIQEKQANADKIDAVYIDGFKAGYSQARFDLEQEPCDEEYIKVPKKALKYRTAGMVAYNAEWLRNHFDIERTVICGSQEPCENAISRQAAIDEIEYEIEMINSALDSMTLDFNARERLRQRRGEAREILNSIQTLPPVTPQQKMGKWIFVDEAKEHAHCSECDYGNVDLFDGRPHNYCPNCGARMETQEEYESCKGCPNICIMYDPDMKGCKDKMEEVEE